jgi:RNA polymerase sigma factor (sigma-70 family)
MSDMGGPVTDDCTDLAALDQGDRDAGRRLYERHAGVVFSLCREETGARCREDAEDAVQETFLRAFRMRDRVTDCRGFRSWLCAIARLVCKEKRVARAKSRRDAVYAVGLDRDAARGFAQRKERPVSEATGTAALRGMSEEAPVRPLERSETLARLGRAIDELPDDIRLALHIFYIEPDPVTAAKQSLGISRAQFYRLVTQARELIGAKLSREDLQS